MSAIGRKASRLKKGAFFVTLTKKLPCPHFDVCESELYQMSWGGATVFIQQKMTDPIDPGPDPPRDPPVSLVWVQRQKPATLRETLQQAADANQTAAPIAEKE